MTVPDWVQDSVFYQIFPDRFANGDPSNDPPNVQPWGAPPNPHGFQGGDLKGITNHLDYLVDLGVGALYLNPIFSAGSNHRYNTSDYLHIDDRLGSLDDFRRLIDRAHGMGIRVILDGVFNHCGRGFAAFRDLLDRGQASEFGDWFHVRRLPLDAFGDGRAENYKAWWGFPSLPKFNTGNPDVRAYLMRVARHWIEQGADGWRLDVPNEIDDPSFWEELHGVVRRANPEAYLLGEIWTVDPRWVGQGAFDGLMNYPLREAILALVCEQSLRVTDFRAEIERQMTAYSEAHRRAHYNLVGSHDTERVATLAGGDEARLCLIFVLQFVLPGAPGIYYGDEIGLEGGKDPDCRRAFPWDTASWNIRRRDLIAALARLRRERIELRRGALEFLLADDRLECLAFVRRLGGEATLVAANLSGAPRRLVLENRKHGWPPGLGVADALTGKRHQVGEAGLGLDLAPLEVVLLNG